MALTAAFFRGSVREPQWAEMADFLGFEGTDGFAVTAAGDGRAVSVGTGYANCGGILGHNDSAFTVSADPNGSASYDRIDRVILRATWGSRTLEVVVKKGTAGPNPQPPSMVRSPRVQYELKIAQLRIAPGQGSFTVDDITYEATPPGRGFYRIASSATAPDPEIGALIYYTAAKSLRVGSGSEYVEIAHARDVPMPKHTSSDDDFAFTNETFSATSSTPSGGAGLCGTSFVAPPSGWVFITVGGTVQSTINGGSAMLSFEVRVGSSIGSGSVVQAASSLRCLRTSEAVNTSAPAMISSTWRSLLTGLTPGATYNVRAMHAVAGVENASGGIFQRYLLVEPV